MNLSKDDAQTVFLDVAREGRICENTRSRIQFDMGLHFATWKTMPEDVLEKILLGHIGRAVFSPTDINKALKRGIAKISRQ